MPDTASEGAAAWQAAMAAHEARIHKGVNVRVRLGECPHIGTWHGTVEDGATGIVYDVRTPADGRPSDHGCYVWFHRSVPPNRKAWSYCAAELIPLAADGAAAGGEGSG